jgi:hypothetical protein
MASRSAEEGEDYSKLASFAEPISGVTPGPGLARCKQKRLQVIIVAAEGLMKDTTACFGIFRVARRSCTFGD